MSCTFETLGLAPSLLRAITEQGYTQPTPIQERAIGPILAGHDVLAGAQTGTGKTAGFTLPMLQRLAGKADTRTSPARHPVRALVLTPTRELAAQVEQSVRTYGRHLPIRSCVIYGGVGMNPQIETLRKGVDILVATPGRLLDHVHQRTVDLGKVEILVLDEADRMLDMGFIRDIRKILALLPCARQNLLFSATFSEEIRRLASGVLRAPVEIEVARRNADAELVSQRVHQVPQERKRDVLAQLVRSGGWNQVLVFTRTKHGANRLAEQLTRDGIGATAIHGNKSQPQRLKALADFKQGSVRILVATDIAARGLDIDALPQVVNFELPHVPEDYVHRIGRTGRAGRSGEAISLVAPDERPQLAAIERLLGRRIPQDSGIAPLACAATPIPARQPAPARQRPATPLRPASQPREVPGQQSPARRGGDRRGSRHAAAPVDATRTPRGRTHEGHGEPRFTPRPAVAVRVARPQRKPAAVPALLRTAIPSINEL
ncbi:MAG: DEAD/DEAH box helicase [Burkholderiales bacterium]|nr:DEAD/DEAH box helicase [Burkholderiales bacterium]